MAELAEKMARLGPDALAIQHTVQVTSFGGSGTTALCAHLLDAEVDLQPGPAQWPFKHRRQTPTAQEVPEGFRVLYLVGDPRDAVLSVFRRGIQDGHYRGLREEAPPPDVAERLRSIETFVAAGVDDFLLADHVHGWLHHPPGYPVMVMRYDDLGVIWPEVAAFIGLPADWPALEIRSRASDWRDQPAPIRDGLTAMYGDLAELIESLPPVQVIE
jgi:hypothetical protein